MSDAESRTNGRDGTALVRVRRSLATVRRRPRRRRVALLVAGLVGLGLADSHWIGLVVAGALVGLVSETVPRAVVGGLVLGVVVLAVHVFGSPAMSVAAFVALRPASYVTVGIALVGPTWGALVRAVL
ncbi:MAG: hypothetical protein ABEI96_05770 [Haloarculaceae archaeon]